MNRTTLFTLCGLLAIGTGTYLYYQHQPQTSLGSLAYQQTEKILFFGPRPPESQALAQVKQHVIKELDACGWKSQEQAFESETPKGTFKFSNIVARQAQHQNTPRLIIGAHLDSKLMKDKPFLGADDSASACAAMIELARYLHQKDPRRAEQIELVFFDGEEAIEKNMTLEDGLYGSRYYATQWRKQTSKPAYGIVLDMIGHKDLRISLPSDSPEDLKKLALDAAQSLHYNEQFQVSSYPITDDHIPLNFSGIPTLDIIGDFSRFAWWHESNDNLENISAESLQISISVVLKMIEKLIP